MSAFLRGFCRGYVRFNLIIIYPCVLIAPVFIYYPQLVKAGHRVWKELWEEA